MFQDRLYINNVLGLGIAQRCISIWELLSNVIRQGIPQQCIRIRCSSAMYNCRVKLNNVMKQAVLQQSEKIAYTTHQCIETGYASVMQ